MTSVAAGFVRALIFPQRKNNEAFVVRQTEY